MQNDPPAKSEAEVLPEAIAERLLARASELDVESGGGSSVIDLRAAAAEAGISPAAFDAALAELQTKQEVPLPNVRERRRRPSRMWALTVLIAALIAGVYARQRAPASEIASPGAPIVEETILLRCLSPREAAELIRPLLALRSNSVVHSSEQLSRLLTVRATQAQLQNVKSVLEKYEGAGSPTCASRPSGGVTP
ncbi:MAG: hypothetical protein ACR2G6_09945 [Gemmatimonadaceae bacterium]